MTGMSENPYPPTAGVIAQAAARPDHLALRQGDVVRTYGELDDRARRVAHALPSSECVAATGSR